ncbi:MAG: hypothetical protein A2140_02300 [Candidatus Muproteobacteria bacterium RBG_16_62_13]|uniref:Uncharacterized protein n=1 Tax=Candidatus Muproteobacteria bacterium RBG_16_62_13 TaxID=1817756 RepID=A0A1F6T773_9PROT|nr:MAG: hypothetical protein A2140_02300 [Candidatus Muproteobacteria bacterium RBG_16_62_13]
MEERPSRKPLSSTAIWLIALTLTMGAWAAGRFEWYTPGSDFGYYLGMAGGIMMLLLLLYPLRKHVRFLNWTGKLPGWFRFHMFLGIAGPLLILYHSTLHVGSLNAKVALYSMILVAGSGIFGRFFYTKIHHGLYGRHSTLQERQERLGLTGGEVKSKFHFAPSVETRLKALEAYASAEASPGMLGIRHALMVGWRVRQALWLTHRDLRRILGKAAVERDWPREKLAQRLRKSDQLVRTYLFALRDVAQYRVYQRLFSLWHVLHVPLVYMLVISGVVHVIAVHMY